MATSSAQIRINGTLYTLTKNASTGKWESTIITAPGATSYNQSGGYYACEIIATNSAGTSSTTGVSDATVGAALKLVVHETIKPTITITSPSAGAYVSNNKQPIVFILADEAGGSGVDLATLVCKIDGSIQTGVTSTAIANGYSCTLTPAATLTDGSHTVTIAVSDHDGNAATAATMSFTIDTVPPTLNVSAPAASYVSPSSTVAYAGTTNDATSSPVTIGVTLDGQAQTAPTVASNGSFSGSFTGLTDGSHTATFKATDAAGKITTITRTFAVDTQVPVVTAVSITPNPVDAGATMVVSVTIT